MKGNPRYRIHLICFVAALVLLALQPASAVVLQYKGKAGEKFTERSSVTGSKIITNLSTGRTIRTKISGSTTEVTRVVSASRGELKLEVNVLSGETTRIVDSGRRQSQPTAKGKHWLRITPQGKVLERKPRKRDEGVEIGARVLRALNEAGDFPAGNINVGDVWRSSLTVRDPGSSKPIPFTVESRLLAIIEFKGHSCAKIRFTFQVPLSLHYDGTGGLPAGTSADMSGKISGVMTDYFDPKLGRQVYSEVTLQSSFNTTVRSQGPSQVMKSKANLTLKSFLLEAAR